MKATNDIGLLTATWLVARKELATSFRDRQTTLYTVVLPIVLYPFVFWCLIQGGLLLQGRNEHTAVRVGIALERGASVPAGILEALAHDPALAGTAHAHDLNLVEVVGPRPDFSPDDARRWLATVRDADDPGRDAVLFLRAGERGAELYFDGARSRSELARARVERRLPKLALQLRDAAARGLGRDPGALEAFRREPDTNVARGRETGAYILSYILPMLLVIMAVMGAFFPAVDLTCGERERKTAETTLLLPVPRTAVHLGKILAVGLTALIATGLNIFALALAAEHLLRMLPHGSSVSVDLPFSAFVRMAPLALLFAFFVSSVLTGVAALARTFKEGQALLGPVQVLFLFPAMAGTLPGVVLTSFLAGVPVVNVVLVFRSVLRGESIPTQYAIAAASLFGLALLAIGLSVRMLSREALLVSERSSPLSGFWRLWRSPRQVE
jgi:sodium transport system permease protein